MTGYGRIQETLNNREITIEIKSVNHRYLDLNIKTPRIYGFLDEHIKKALSSVISRGKIDIYLTIDISQKNDVKIEINQALVEQYISVLRETCNKYNIQDDITISNLTKLPDIISIQKEQHDSDELLADVMSVLQKTLIQFEKMRTFEGEQLRKDVLLRKDNIQNLVNIVEKRSPQIVLDYRNRLFAKLEEVLNSTTIAQDRILAECAVFSDKVNTSEETVRLNSHISQLCEMCDTQGAIGRKMDFLIQEFNREANTIGSKCTDSEITKIVVELKSEIEKIREQIQNVE